MTKVTVYDINGEPLVLTIIRKKLDGTEERIEDYRVEGWVMACGVQGGGAGCPGTAGITKNMYNRD